MNYSETSTYLSDIPHAVALAAHSGTSFVPERRADQVVTGWADEMSGRYKAFAAMCTTDADRAALEHAFPFFHRALLTSYLTYLRSRHGMVSTMIAGASKFPARRQNKLADRAHAHVSRYLSLAEHLTKKMIRRLVPQYRPIMSGDSDAVTRLEEKIAEQKAEQARMKLINARHRMFKKDPTGKWAADLTEAEQIRIKNYQPQYSWEPNPHAPFELSNLGACIRTNEKRLEGLKARKAAPVQVVTSTDGDIRAEVDNPANRVRLFFPGKPDADVRQKLKSNGFRWAPSNGCWQAYCTDRAVAIASEFVKPQTVAA